MSSRDAILQAVRRNRPAPVPLPPLDAFPVPEVDLVEHFKTVMDAIGGHAREVEEDAVAATIAALYPDAAAIASDAPGYRAGGAAPAAAADPHDLAHLDLFVARGRLGVAESGAVWVPESETVHRAALFVAQHVVLLLHRKDLVWNLHEAYVRLRVQEEGWGAFIAGPSKTADIEQALVIGAHGPRSLTVLLL